MVVNLWNDTSCSKIENADVVINSWAIATQNENVES